MEKDKAVIAQNIADLRKKQGMTQFELAEKLNYSDKAVSKWERGESVPDVFVLKDIAELFGVTLDYLVQEEHSAKDSSLLPSRHQFVNRGFITGMSILFVWLIALFIFVLLDILPGNICGHWLAFIYAVPISFIVWLVLNALWFNRKMNFVIISLLMWSVLVTVCLTMTVLGHNIWLFMVLGAPGQVIIFFWSRLKFAKHNL